MGGDPGTGITGNQIQAAFPFGKAAFLLARLVFNNLRAFDVVPVVTESLVMSIAGQVLTFLGLIGVIVDPTTAGVGDLERALGYEEPWEDK